MTITPTINDHEVRVPDGSSVLHAINTSDTYISQLCRDPDMKAIGASRTCLVQIDGGHRMSTENGEDNDKKKSRNSRAAIGSGVALGVGVGVAIGGSIDNMGAGLAIGVAIGIGAWTGMKKSR